MIKDIINDIIKQLRPYLPAGLQITIETDNQKSPSVSIWTADSDVEEVHEIIYTNWIVREPKGNYGSVSRSINHAIINFQQIDNTNYTVFGLSIPQGIRKLNYTGDNSNVEYILSIKVFYVQK